MPIYEFKCEECGQVSEIICRLSDKPRTLKCVCGGVADSFIGSNGAGLTDNKVPWLDSAIKVLQRDGEPPITTRTEYKAYLKKNELECIG
jgi:putative FmdB family regulatory protein